MFDFDGDFEVQDTFDGSEWNDGSSPFFPEFDQDEDDDLCGEAEDDGQPDEYTEWQDFMGGDDWDNGQFD